MADLKEQNEYLIFCFTAWKISSGCLPNASTSFQGGCYDLQTRFFDTSGLGTLNVVTSDSKKQYNWRLIWRWWSLICKSSVKIRWIELLLIPSCLKFCQSWNDDQRWFYGGLSTFSSFWNVIGCPEWAWSLKLISTRSKCSNHSYAAHSILLESLLKHLVSFHCLFFKQ